MGRQDADGVDTRQQIILTLLQDRPPDEEIGRLNALGEGEWREVLKAANVQGVEPLLLGRIQRLHVSPPREAAEALRQSLLNNTARNLQLIRHFADLGAALQRENLPFMPLKGVYLCTNVYENLGERSIWDIDLIVPLADLKRALTAIEGTGYHPARPYDLELEIRNYHHVPAYLKAGAPPLEVHWALLNPRFQQGLAWQDVWGRSVPAHIGRTSVQVLSPEDLLVYLCAHVAYQHMYIDSIRSLYDIRLVLKTFGDGLDWHVIAQRARTAGLQNSLYLTLRLTDDLLGPALPEAVRQTLRPPGFNETLTQAATTRLVDGEGVSPVVNAVWNRRRPFERLKGLWDRIAVPPSILAGRYRLPPNSRRVYFFYLVRAWDLLRIHGGNLLVLLLGGPKVRERAARDSELVAYLSWWK